MEDFRKYATKTFRMNSNALDSYMNITSSYISPTIIEERQLNVAQMDVFFTVDDGPYHFFRYTG